MVERHSPSEELRRLYDTFVLEDVGKNTCHFDKQHPRFQAAIKENTSPLVLLGASVSLQRMRSLVGVPKHFEIENAEQLQSRFFLFSKASRQEHRLAESGKPRKSSLFRRGEGIAAESLVYFLASQAGLSVAVSNMREDTLGQDLHLRINGSEVSVDITSNNSFEFASKKLRNTNSLTLFLPFRHGEKMIDKNLFKEYHELLVEMTHPDSAIDAADIAYGRVSGLLDEHLLSSREAAAGLVGLAQLNRSVYKEVFAAHPEFFLTDRQFLLGKLAWVEELLTTHLDALRKNSLDH